MGCPGDREEIERRADTIRESLSRPGVEEGEAAFLRTRLSRLTGGVAIIIEVTSVRGYGAEGPIEQSA